MADLSFVFDQENGYSDLQIVGGDFLLGDTLQTAVEISIFTDRRTTTSEAQIAQRGIQDRQSRRGYWANFFRETPQGSGLWLLQREKKTQETLARAKTICNDSLSWLISTGVAQSVTTSTSFDGDALIIFISILKPDGQEAGFKYNFAWDSLRVIG